LACYVDEGRSEGRRPEFSGEVSRELACRIRKLIGGDIRRGKIKEAIPYLKETAKSHYLKRIRAFAKKAVAVLEGTTAAKLE
jgi:hypothetical protein